MHRALVFPVTIFYDFGQLRSYQIDNIPIYFKLPCRLRYLSAFDIIYKNSCKLYMRFWKRCFIRLFWPWKFKFLFHARRGCCVLNYLPIYSLSRKIIFPEIVIYNLNKLCIISNQYIIMYFFIIIYYTFRW